MINKVQHVFVICVLCLLCVVGFMFIPAVSDSDKIVDDYIGTINGSYVQKQLSAVKKKELIDNSNVPVTITVPQITTSSKVPDNYNADDWIAYINSTLLTPTRREVCLYALQCYKDRVEYSQESRQLAVENPRYIDCSGLIYNAYWHAKLSPMPSSYTGAMINEIIEKDTSQLLPGDVVCYRRSNSGHIMMYMGTNKDGPIWCHASGSKEDMKLNPRSFEDIKNTASYVKVKFGTFAAMKGV